MWWKIRFLSGVLLLPGWLIAAPSALSSTESGGGAEPDYFTNLRLTDLTTEYPNELLNEFRKLHQDAKIIYLENFLQLLIRRAPFEDFQTLLNERIENLGSFPERIGWDLESKQKWFYEMTIFVLLKRLTSLVEADEFRLAQIPQRPSAERVAALSLRSLDAATVHTSLTRFLARRANQILARRPEATETELLYDLMMEVPPDFKGELFDDVKSVVALKIKHRRRDTCAMHTAKAGASL